MSRAGGRGRIDWQIKLGLPQEAASRDAAGYNLSLENFFERFIVGLYTDKRLKPGTRIKLILPKDERGIDPGEIFAKRFNLEEAKGKRQFIGTLKPQVYELKLKEISRGYIDYLVVRKYMKARGLNRLSDKGLFKMLYAIAKWYPDEGLADYALAWIKRLGLRHYPERNSPYRSWLNTISCIALPLFGVAAIVWQFISADTGILEAGLTTASILPIIGNNYSFGRKKNKGKEELYRGEIDIASEAGRIQRFDIAVTQLIEETYFYSLFKEGKRIAHASLNISKEGRPSLTGLRTDIDYRTKAIGISLAKVLFNIILRDALAKAGGLDGFTANAVMTNLADAKEATPEIISLLRNYQITGFNRDLVRAVVSDKYSEVTLIDKKLNTDLEQPFFEVVTPTNFIIKLVLKGKDGKSIRDKATYLKLWQLSSPPAQGELKSRLVELFSKDILFVGGYIDYRLNPAKADWLKRYIESLSDNPWNIKKGHSVTQGRYSGRTPRGYADYDDSSALLDPLLFGRRRMRHYSDGEQARQEETSYSEVYHKAIRQDRSEEEIRFDVHADRLYRLERQIRLAYQEALQPFINRLSEISSQIKITEEPDGLGQLPLAKQSEKLRGKIRPFENRFRKAYQVRDDQRLTELNREIVKLLIRRLKIQLSLAKTWLETAKSDRRRLVAAINTIRGARSTCKRSTWEYSWQRRRETKAIRIEKISSIGYYGSVIETFLYKDLDINVLAPDAGHPKGRVTIRQQRWVTAVLADGTKLREKQWRDIPYEDWPAGLRSQIHTLVNYEIEYSTILHYLGDLEYCYERLSEYKRRLPTYIYQQLEESLTNALAWTKRGLVAGKRLASENLEFALAKLKENDINTLLKELARTTDNIEARAREIEEIKKRVNRRLESVYLHVRNSDIKEKLVMVKENLNSDTLEEAEDLVSELRQNYFTAQVKEGSYKYLEDKILTIFNNIDILKTDITMALYSSVFSKIIEDIGFVLIYIEQYESKIKSKSAGSEDNQSGFRGRNYYNSAFSDFGELSHRARMHYPQNNPSLDLFGIDRWGSMFMRYYSPDNSDIGDSKAKNSRMNVSIRHWLKDKGIIDRLKNFTEEEKKRRSRIYRSLFSKAHRSIRNQQGLLDVKREIVLYHKWAGLELPSGWESMGSGMNAQNLLNSLIYWYATEQVAILKLFGRKAPPKGMTFIDWVQGLALKDLPNSLFTETPTEQPEPKPQPKSGSGQLPLFGDENDPLGRSKQRGLHYLDEQGRLQPGLQEQRDIQEDDNPLNLWGWGRRMRHYSDGKAARERAQLKALLLALDGETVDKRRQIKRELLRPNKQGIYPLLNIFADTVDLDEQMKIYHGLFILLDLIHVPELIDFYFKANDEDTKKWIGILLERLMTAEYSIRTQSPKEDNFIARTTFSSRLAKIRFYLLDLITSDSRGISTILDCCASDCLATLDIARAVHAQDSSIKIIAMDLSNVVYKLTDIRRNIVVFDSSGNLICLHASGDESGLLEKTGITGLYKRMQSYLRGTIEVGREGIVSDSYVDEEGNRIEAIYLIHPEAIDWARQYKLEFKQGNFFESRQIITEGSVDIAIAGNALGECWRYYDRYDTLEALKEIGLTLREQGMLIVGNNPSITVPVDFQFHVYQRQASELKLIDTFGQPRVWNKETAEAIPLVNTQEDRLADGLDGEASGNNELHKLFPKKFVMENSGMNREFCRAFEKLIKEAGFSTFETSRIGTQRFEVQYKQGLNSALTIFGDFIYRISQVFRVDEELAKGIIVPALRHESQHLKDKKLLEHIESDIDKQGLKKEEARRLFKRIAEQLANRARGSELDIARDVWFKCIFSNPAYSELSNDEQRMRELVKKELNESYPSLIYFPDILEIENPRDEQEIIRLVLSIDKEIGPRISAHRHNGNSDRLADGARGLLLEEEAGQEQGETEGILKQAEAILATSERIIYMSEYPGGIGKKEFSQLDNVIIKGYRLGKNGGLWLGERGWVRFPDKAGEEAFVYVKEGYVVKVVFPHLNEEVLLSLVIDNHTGKIIDSFYHRLSRERFMQYSDVTIKHLRLSNEGRLEIGRKSWARFSSYPNAVVDLLVKDGIVFRVSLVEYGLEQDLSLVFDKAQGKVVDAFVRLTRKELSRLDNVTIKKYYLGGRGALALGRKVWLQLNNYPYAEVELDIRKGMVTKVRVMEN
ncbi:hypothetical protein ACFL1D_04545, partial [Candidatus Omnitrophota bacterium]